MCNVGRLSLLSLPLAMVAGLIGLTSAVFSASPGQPSLASPDSRLFFEVASVRRNTGGPGTWSRPIRSLPGGRFEAIDARLADLIRYAYELEFYQDLEGRQGILNDRFDIAARAMDDRAGPADHRLMLQALLAERFRLVVHWEEREQDVYVLALAREDGRLGPALRPSTVDCADHHANAPPVRDLANVNLEELLFCTFMWQDDRLRARGHRMGEIATSLSHSLQRPVLDRTGLPGLYELDLWASMDGLRSPTFPPPPGERPPDATAANGSDAPSLFAALREQAGLGLAPQRAPVPVLIVEEVHPLTEN
jgi:uncharacterized protein (TIGR03435 family)